MDVCVGGCGAVVGFWWGMFCGGGAASVSAPFWGLGVGGGGTGAVDRPGLPALLPGSRVVEAPGQGPAVAGRVATRSALEVEGRPG